MNNLHRQLAQISGTAWAQIEEETTRTLKRYLAGRRVVDVLSPAGNALPGVATGHLVSITPPAKGRGVVTASTIEKSRLVVCTATPSSATAGSISPAYCRGPPELHGPDLADLVLIFAFVDQPCRAGFGYETRNPPESEQEGYFGIVSTTVDESADKLPCVSADCTA